MPSEEPAQLLPPEQHQHNQQAVLIRNRAAWVVGMLSTLVPLIGYPIVVLDPSPGAPPMSVGSRVVGAAICSVMELLFWHLGRLRTVVDTNGIRVYGFMRRMSLPWSVVDGFTLTNALHVRVSGGRMVNVPGFMAGPGQAASGNPAGRRALRQLTELKAALDVNAGDPPGHPARYRSYVDIWVLLGALVLFLLIALG
jgi:hypothetical protein